MILYTDPMEDSPDPKVLLYALGISVVVCAGVYFAYQSAKSRTGTIVLPGGITYLGPTPTTQTTIESPPSTGGKIPIAADAKWIERKGTIYPYVFLYPETLSLGVFPKDPYDSITVFYGNTDANTNIFFRVDDLTKQHKTAYVGKPMEYAQNWWKDYSWKGVSTVTAFTNSNGLKGYRATYLDQSDKTPYDHVFFEVPGHTELIIWVNGKLFTQDTFDKLVDSIAWSK